MALLNALFLTFSLHAIPILSSEDATQMMTDFNTGGLERVQVDSVAGRIHIAPTESGRFEARLKKTKSSEGCKATMDREEFSRFHLRVDSPSFAECEVEIEIRVPKQIDLEINAGASRVDIEGVEGQLKFRAGTGPLSAEGRFKRLEGLSGNGEINVRGVDGGGRITTDGGRVNLTFLDSAKGDFSVNTKSGEALVTVPKGRRVNAELKSADGQVVNDALPDSRANLGLNISSTSGNVSVKSE